MSFFFLRREKLIKKKNEKKSSRTGQRKWGPGDVITRAAACVLGDQSMDIEQAKQLQLGSTSSPEFK